MATKEQLKHGFTVMYEKGDYYYGSYDLFPSKDDVRFIKVAVWRGHEESDDLTPEEIDQLINEEEY